VIKTKIKTSKVGLVIFLTGISLFLVGSNLAMAAEGYTYQNHATVKVDGKDLFGWTMAWVESKWTFATQPGGYFFLSEDDTFHQTDHGGHWPDDGSWGFTTVSECRVGLSFSGNFKLHSPFNSISGTLYNKVVYHPWDYTYAWYRGVGGVNLEWQELPEPPIEIEVGE